MLGQLYHPKGLALETAQAVLECENPHACNVALGCPNRCPYCYGPQVTHQSREAWSKARGPETPAWVLVQKQLETMETPEGVFLSFLTDPLHECNRVNTRELIEVLRYENVKNIATLSKVGISHFDHVFHGMSLVSLEDRFWHKFEPYTTKPMRRLQLLKERENESFVWLSMEPYPISAIYKQDIQKLLDELKFVDLIVFGMWNYDARARTNVARREYEAYILTLRDFTKSNNIRLHIKSDTLSFIGGL